MNKEDTAFGDRPLKNRTEAWIEGGVDELNKRNEREHPQADWNDEYELSRNWWIAWLLRSKQTGSASHRPSRSYLQREHRQSIHDHDNQASFDPVVFGKFAATGFSGQPVYAIQLWCRLQLRILDTRFIRDWKKLFASG